MLETALITAAVVVAVYAALVLGFVLAGRRSDARALARFVPDCLVLFRRLLGDPGVARARKALLGLVVLYLAMPFDLIPDFIPVAGQVDDAIIVGLVLRGLVRSAGPELVRRHWPGPEESLRALMRLAGARVS